MPKKCTCSEEYYYGDCPIHDTPKRKPKMKTSKKKTSKKKSPTLLLTQEFIDNLNAEMGEFDECTKCTISVNKDGCYEATIYDQDDQSLRDPLGTYSLENGLARMTSKEKLLIACLNHLLVTNFSYADRVEIINIMDNGDTTWHHGEIYHCQIEDVDKYKIEHAEAILAKLATSQKEAAKEAAESLRIRNKKGKRR